MGLKFLKNNWQVLSLNIFVLLAFILFWGHFGDVNFDSFREAYIPMEILKGEVLYKNVFNIYAPFAYLFNALLFKLFGVHLGVLYFAGLFATLGIVNLVFNISNKFLDKLSSFSIVLFIFSASVLSPNVFNFIFPYSYGMLYGLLFVLASIYFALSKKMPLSYLMYSFAVCSKYEFILLLPLLLFFSHKKDFWKYILALILPLILTVIPLFPGNVGFNNILASYQITLSMTSTKTLYWFYSVMGLVFRWELIPIYLLNLAKVVIPAAFLYYFRSWWLVLILLVYFYFIISPEILIYAFPLILILYALKFRTLSREKHFIILASLLISMKVFFALTLQSYGVFFIPFALIPIFILTKNRFRKTLISILLICAITLGVKNIASLMHKNIKIKTDMGVVCASSYEGNSINELIKYIDTKTSKNDKILVLPEGLVINFMTNRASDNKFYSLIPLYVETFGEELIEKRLEKFKPDYIVLSNLNTSNYYYSYFGQDYAGKIFEFVLENYTKQANIGDKLIFTVFKRN